MTARPISTSQAPDPVRSLSPWRQGLVAARANLLPGTLLQAAALALVLGYYFWPPMRAALDNLAAWKTTHALLFAFTSTALSGAVLPHFLQYLQRAGRTKTTWVQLPFLILFWGYKGIEVDFFYHLQARWFGHEPTWAVVVQKVLIDQAIYTIWWAIPTTVLFYAFKDAGFNVRRARILLGPHWIRVRLIPMIISNWFVWLPAVAIIYCLPTALQLPLQNIVLCIWALMVIFMTGEELPPAAAPDMPSPDALEPERDAAAVVVSSPPLTGVGGPCNAVSR